MMVRKKKMARNNQRWFGKLWEDQGTQEDRSADYRKTNSFDLCKEGRRIFICELPSWNNVPVSMDLYVLRNWKLRAERIWAELFGSWKDLDESIRNKRSAWLWRYHWSGIHLYYRDWCWKEISKYACACTLWISQYWSERCKGWLLQFEIPDEFVVGYGPIVQNRNLHVYRHRWKAE